MLDSAKLRRRELRSSAESRDSGDSLNEEEEEPDTLKDKNVKHQSSSTSTSLWNRNNYRIIILIIALCMFLVLIYNGKQVVWWKKEMDFVSLLKKVENKYPNQDATMWSYISLLLNASHPSVHTIILLHKDDGLAANCIAVDIAKLLNTVMASESDVIIYEDLNDSDDYGTQLVKYLEIVKESKHLVVKDLEKIPAGRARVFQGLCDDASVKPSYFIFTLRDLSNSTESPTRVARADFTLKNIWRDLADNELHPLITRVARIVFPVANENIKDCN